VIRLVRIAQVGIFIEAVARAVFDLQIVAASAADLSAGSTEQFEHLRDMLRVGLAKLLLFVVFLQVVFALRQPQAALNCAPDHSRAVLGHLDFELKRKSAPTPLRCSSSASASRSARLLIPRIRASSGSSGFVPAASMAVVSMQLA